jgi:LPS-assembly protein
MCFAFKFRNVAHAWLLSSVFSTSAFAIVPMCLDGEIKTPNIAIQPSSLTQTTIEQQLGWVKDNTLARCGGYYIEAPFTYADSSATKKLVEITSDQTLFSQHGTSVLQGNVIVSQLGQQVTANKGYLYRDAATGKINAIDLMGNVNLREPNNLVVANTAHMDLKNKTQTLHHLVYRTAIYSNSAVRPPLPSNQSLQSPRTVTQLSAWGVAQEFEKVQPKVFEITDASYSTCPPDSTIWQIKAKHIELNKNTGRGVARNARFYFKKIPVFYAPYLNFPIDNRRETGFLFPSVGSSNKFGPYLGTPFYWNMAPNFDTTITPLFMQKRGLQLNDLFRYISPSSSGNLKLSVTPDDRAFSTFQSDAQGQFGGIDSSVTEANLRRLENASDARGSFAWQDTTHFNQHWAGNVDYNYVTDDYYLRDFGHNLNEVTENQLLQKADLSYTGQNWNFISRIQQYETLHPVDAQTVTLNQYKRFPQLVLDGDYPDQRFGFDYFISNEATRFDILNTPGIDMKYPVGDRWHTQPGVSLPLSVPYFYVTPRAQFFLNEYNLGDVSNLMNKHASIALPIIDISSGLYFDRDINFLGHAVRETLEPVIYYVYIPYHNQAEIPVFDTTANTLTYDQLFMYNRFSGLDRLGDANQVSLGITTRFIESETGFERIRAAAGEIIYFANRNVTICSVDNPNCLNPTAADNNLLRRSPLAGVLTYALNPWWSLTGNAVWNTQSNEMDNENVALQFHKDSLHIINIAYNFVRNGDIQPGTAPNDSANNLKQLDFSFAWPLSANWSAIGRWTQSINQAHFQNQLYGLQYDSCCWAARFVAGKTFTNLNINGTPVYDNQVYVQFALRGLGNFGSGDPTQYVSSNIGGFSGNFGQDF